jgi:hypothetical protein
MASWKYTLNSELAQGLGDGAAPLFSNPWLTIERAGAGVRIRVHAGYAWDGCTCAPDLPGTRLASCLHDAVYQFAEAIGAASGWSVRAVLRWGDRIFRERMRADGAGRPATWLYFLAVRLFGYRFHQAARHLRGRRLRWRTRPVDARQS